MPSRTAENYVDYQQRASEFAVDDIVVPFGWDDSMAGRVTAVWPAIGMVDVEFATGNKRYPVEELTRINKDNTIMSPPLTDSTPGGAVVQVPGGPHPPVPEGAKKEANASRVAEAFVKKSLYWSGPDRKYRAPAAEVATGKFKCPKCRARGIDSDLRPAAYKRREGQSEKLLGCGNCLFLIKRIDIINCQDDEGGA